MDASPPNNTNTPAPPDPVKPETPPVEPAPPVGTPAVPPSDPIPPVDPATPLSGNEMQSTGTPPTPPMKPLSKKMLYGIGGAVVLILLIVIIAIASGSSKKTTDTTQKTTISKTPVGGINQVKTTPTPAKSKALSQTLVYGAWTGQTSAITAVNLGTSETTLLASLPIQVKKINVLSSNNLLYIDQTDYTTKLGPRISIYSIKDATITTSIPAAAGFSIQDYVISANKRYLAIWEVNYAQGATDLQGGQSRVYSVDLTNPTVTNLLYDETSAPTQIDTPVVPVHYPRAILDDGTVFSDTYIPDDVKGGPGWAYGMSKVDFDGTNKLDLDTMQSGTYGTQPTLSPDGKYLLFAGYDGSLGDGNAQKNGTRQALLTPNTVDLVNTQTLQRFTLPNLPTSNEYTSASWDNETGNVILHINDTDPTKSGTYIYDLSSKALTEVVTPTNAQYGIISEIAPHVELIGIQDLSPSNLGDLGDSNAYAYTQFALYDTATSKANYISVQDTYPQFITILPPDYFKKK